MVERQTRLVPGVLKQNFSQSPYWIVRPSRWPRMADSAFGLSAPASAPEFCWPWARRGRTVGDSSSNASIERRIVRGPSTRIIRLLISFVLLEKPTDQRE